MVAGKQNVILGEIRRSEPESIILHTVLLGRVNLKEQQKIVI